MRNRRNLLLFITILILCGLPFILRYGKTHVTGRLMTASEEGNVLYLDRYGLKLFGIDKGGVTWFCLPAYASLSRIDQSGSESKIFLPDGSVLSDPDLGNVQDIFVRLPEGDPVPWKICFLRSENLNSVFLDTGDLPVSDIDHDIYSDTAITVITPTGFSVYTEKNAKLKGRGNATWEGEKKPYELKLPKKVSLCDMSPSKKWVLIANYFEATKLYNKTAFDASKAIGMEYSIESDWIDLYANGVYLGNYLLCKEPDTGSSGLDIGDIEALNDPFFDPDTAFETEDMKGYDYESSIPVPSGRYLIEKNTTSYYIKKNCGFKTDFNTFTIKSPNNADLDQIEYISSFVKDLDASLREDPAKALSDIDQASFIRRFLIEELFFNNDSMVTSYYFYKKPDDDLLYAGPVWDYDGSLGEAPGFYSDYDGSVLDQKTQLAFEDIEIKNPLDWDVILYENDRYRSCLIDTFKESLPVFLDILENKIDADYEHIAASLKMDNAVWGRGWGAGHYDNTDNNIRFMKFFLAKRLSYLCRKWELPDAASGYDLSDGTEHTLYAELPDGNMVTYPVKDGDQISPDALPAYDEAVYTGWVYKDTYRPFSYFVPVYEDMTVELMPIGEDD